MSALEENKAFLRRYFEEIWNKGNLALLGAFLVPEYVEHSKAFVPAWRTAFPDLHMTLDELIAEGDKVIAGFTMRGTHQGELKGEKLPWLPRPLPSTGKRVEMRGLFVYVIQGGKIQRHGHWGLMDYLGLLRQLGAIPPAESV